VGIDTAGFARSRGFEVFDRSLEQCGFESQSLDGVFIWNCFEQLGAPRRITGEIRRILKPGGILVIQIPDAEFYLAVRRSGSPRSLAILGYNAILGWPHLRGYSEGSARRFFSGAGFSAEGSRRVEVIRPLRTAMQRWARAEEAALLSDPRNLGWLEMVLRRE
jgi:SAM-dependent methyltransferase